MNRRATLIHTAALKPLALGLTLILVVAAGSRSYYARQRAWLNSQRDAYNTLLFNIAENGVRAHIRNGVYHPDHLEDWFTGLVVAANLGGLRLSGRDNLPIVQAGVFYRDEMKEPSDSFYEIEQQLPQLEALTGIGWRRGGPRGGPGGGGPGGGGGWRPLPPGPYTFSLAINPHPWDAQFASLRNQSLAGAALAMGCIVLATLLLALHNRQKRLQAVLQEAENTAARQTLLATLGAGLAHETKNPLGLIRGMAQGILTRADIAPEVGNRAAQIMDEVDRVAGQIDHFLSLAKPVEPSFKPVSLPELFTKLESLVHDEAAASSIAFTVTALDIVLMTDEDLLRKAVLNLVLNAFKASNGGGEVALWAERTGRHTATIAVRDRGCGISEADLSRVLDPYFSRFDEGVGLGLTLTSEIAQKLGGKLLLESELGKGTVARILNLPLGGQTS